MFLSFFQKVEFHKTKQYRVIAYLDNILYFRSTNPEWMGGFPFRLVWEKPAVKQLPRSFPFTVSSFLQQNPKHALR